ncbi:MAG: hypothetical protein KDC38_21245, partial [Planctomycetes bacterium]|nr:hypothetical protein [Planctomycetota bacterium]
DELDPMARRQLANDLPARLPPATRGVLTARAPVDLPFASPAVEAWIDLDDAHHADANREICESILASSGVQAEWPAEVDVNPLLARWLAPEVRRRPRTPWPRDLAGYRERVEARVASNAAEVRERLDRALALLGVARGAIPIDIFRACVDPDGDRAWEDVLLAVAPGGIVALRREDGRAAIQVSHPLLRQWIHDRADVELRRRAREQLLERSALDLDVPVREALRGDVERIDPTPRVPSVNPTPCPLPSVALSPTGTSVTRIALLPDGRVASIGAGNVATVWSPLGERLAEITGHDLPIRDLAVFPDGDLLTVGWDEVIRLWGPDGESRSSFRGGNRPLTACDIVPGGDSFVTAAWDGDVRRWDRATGRLLETFAGARGVPEYTRTTDAGLVIITDRGSLCRWSPEDEGSPSTCLSVAKGTVTGFDAIRRGPLQDIVVARGDRSVARWCLTTNMLLASSPPASASIVSVAISPDGSRIAVADARGTVRVMDADLERVIVEWVEPGGSIALRFGDEGELVVLTSQFLR